MTIENVQDSKKQEPDRMISRLLRLASDRDTDSAARGTLARLRRGAGKGPAYPPEALRFVGPWLDRKDADARLLVATLFALHPSSPGKAGNLGDTMRQAKDAAGSESVERRFLRLLDASPEELGGHLRHAVSLAAAKGVSVNWDRLLRDARGLLSGAPDWRQDVVRAWAASFWREKPPKDKVQNSASESTADASSES